MKVYLDQQIWAYLYSGSLNYEIIERTVKNSNCEYYLSVAHLEELHNSELKETPDKIGLTSKLESFMKDHTVSGIIKESSEGIRFYKGEKEYKEARDTVWGVNTVEIVQNLSNIGLNAQKSNGISPKNLFEGRTQNSDTEYRDVWETDSVRRLLKNNCIENVKYKFLKDDFLLLNSTMTSAFGVLTSSGYKRDSNEKLHNSGAYDIQHAIRATFCDVFVTNDEKLRCKFKAVAYYLDIPIEVLDFEEFKEKYT